MSSYWFIPLIIESILLLICIAYSSGTLATISLIIAGLVIHFAGFVNLINLVSNNYINLLLGSLAYIVIGTGWALAKWTMYLLERKNKYIEDKTNFIKTFTGPGDANKAWKDSRFHHKAPNVSYYKGRIALWFFYWPFSVINTLIHDFTKKAFNLVYNSVKGLFQSISNRIFMDIDKD